MFNIFFFFQKKKLESKDSSHVNPNHVRFVKGVYLRSLKKRSKEQGINRKEILKKDIEEFDITIFDKIKKKIKCE